jgi:hypothetical protein
MAFGSTTQGSGQPSSIAALLPFIPVLGSMNMTPPSPHPRHSRCHPKWSAFAPGQKRWATTWKSGSGPKGNSTIATLADTCTTRLARPNERTGLSLVRGTRCLPTRFYSKLMWSSGPSLALPSNDSASRLPAEGLAGLSANISTILIQGLPTRLPNVGVGDR